MKNPHNVLGLAVAASMIGAANAGPRVIITEIMYNPLSEERRGETEWVEIANVGDESIEISNWRLDDEDKDDWGPFSCTLPPRAVAVLINSAKITDPDFRAAWDADASAPGSGPGPTIVYQVIPVKWGGLSNQAPGGNETVQLLNDKGEVMCEVNYDTTGDWPRIEGAGGPSIWLIDVTATDLNNGRMWRASKAGEYGARPCRVMAAFTAADIGSPGYVENIEGITVVTKPVEPAKPGQAPQKPLARPEDEQKKDGAAPKGNKVPF